jgi:hypothetical protein
MGQKILIEIEIEELSEATPLALGEALQTQLIGPIHATLVNLLEGEFEGVRELTEAFRSNMGQISSELAHQVSALYAMRIPRELPGTRSAAGRLRHLLGPHAAHVWVLGKRSYDLASKLTQHDRLDDAEFLVALGCSLALNELSVQMRQRTSFDPDGFLEQNKQPSFEHGSLADALQREQLPGEHTRRICYDDDLIVWISPDAVLTGIELYGDRAREHLSRSGVSITTGVVHELEILGLPARDYILDHSEETKRKCRFFTKYGEPSPKLPAPSDAAKHLAIQRVLVEIAVRADETDRESD